MVFTAPLDALAPRPIVLLVEDDGAHAELASRALSGAGAPEIHVVESVSAARHWLSSCSADLILADLRLPDGSGLDLLEQGSPLLILTSQGDEARAVAAMKGGALDYVVKSPELYRDLPLVIERALRAANSERSRRRAELLLKESEARFQQLAEHIREAFWLYDVASDRLLYASPAMTTVYRIDSDQLDKGSEDRLAAVHADDLARVRDSFFGEAQRSPTEIEYRVVDGAGSRWIHERTFPVLGEDGRCVRVAGLGADVTKRREMEATLRQSQKMEAIGQLAGGVAHDFNNMLTAIMSAGEELLEISTSPLHRELCTMIVSASERAADLTRKLLAFSRKGRVQNTQVDMHVVVRDTIALLERSIDRAVRLTTDLRAASAVVLGDVAQLQNALLNLGINARDAMPDGGEVCFSSELCKLDEAGCSALPFALEPGVFLQLSVRDNGAGIPVEALARVFEPFFTLKEVGKGTGLGLAAVYGTMVEHHGAVAVYSEPGRGTVFHLYLPLSQLASDQLEHREHVPRGSGLILLIDDEPLVLAAGAQLLKSLGYDVITARDGEEGLRRFEAAHSELSAVLCDLVMPRMSGAQLLPRLRELAPDVPVVLASGFPRDDRVDSGAEPADAFLSKPFHRSDLARALATVISRKPQRSG